MPISRVAVGQTLTDVKINEIIDTVNAATAGSAIIGVTNDTSTGSTVFPLWTTATSGNISAGSVSNTKLYLTPSTGALYATSFNGIHNGSGSGLSGIPNSATTATSGNSANTIVARDSSGNFSAGTIIANLNGTASTANQLNSSNTYTMTGLRVNAPTNAATLIFKTGGASNEQRPIIQLQSSAGVARVNMGIENNERPVWWTYNTAGASSGAIYLYDGNVLATGTVAGLSDERVKTNWRPVTENFVTKLSLVKSGIYDRTDYQTTQAGVSAQSLREVLPESVLEDDSNEKRLSVAYGNAALVSAVELAKEVVALKSVVALLIDKVELSDEAKAQIKSQLKI